MLCWHWHVALCDYDMQLFHSLSKLWCLECLNQHWSLRFCNTLFCCSCIVSKMITSLRIVYTMIKEFRYFVAAEMLTTWSWCVLLCFSTRHFTIRYFGVIVCSNFSVVLCCSDNFLALEIFYGTLMTEEISQKRAYDGFAFFCEFVRRLIYTYVNNSC